jgi:hypothetical protein
MTNDIWKIARTDLRPLTFWPLVAAGVAPITAVITHVASAIATVPSQVIAVSANLPRVGSDLSSISAQLSLRCAATLVLRIFAHI